MHQTGNDYDIAIVGGGMVGLTLALLLSRQVRTGKKPWRVALVESHPLGSPTSSTSLPASFDARSTALAEGSRAILTQCGVWPLLAEHLTAIEQVHVSDRGHFAGNLLRAEDLAYPALGYVAENPRLGRALLTVLKETRGISVLAPGQVAQTKRTDTGWQLQLTNESIQCQLLVLADGSVSSLGQRLGIPYRIERYNQRAVIANIECDRPHRGIAYERFTDQGPIALLPLGYSPASHLSALVWTRPDHAEDVMGLTDLEFCRRLQLEFGHRAGRFCRVSQRFIYPLQLAVATEQVRAGLVLMGNAAHFLHPVAGQGFNLALRDCRALVDAVADAEDPGALPSLQTYLRRQQQDQYTTINLSHSLVKLFSSNALPSTLLRSLGLLSLDAIGPAKRQFAKQAMGFPPLGNHA